MPPTAPLPTRGVEAYAALVLFTLLAGDAWRNSISWLGWGILLAVLAIIGGGMLWSRRRRIRPEGTPYPLLVFLVLATLSVAWSAYPEWSALGALAQWVTTAGAALLAFVLSWHGLLRALERAIKAILGLSLVFELVVSLIVRHPVLPFWTDWELDEVPLMYQWSRMKLFEGGPIQGIVGNSSTLGFIALLGVIVLTIGWCVIADGRDPSDPRLWAAATTRMRLIRQGAWLALALIMVLLTASATVVLALGVLVAVTVLVLAMRRVRPGRARTLAYAALAAIVAAVIIAVAVMRESLLSALASSGLLTGRLDIWQTVGDLIAERPAFGWGWVSYWVPFVEPFDNLVVRNDTEQLHAHNAWVDVTFQLGIVGVIVFAALVLSVATRAWFIAVDGHSAPHRGDRVLSLLPLLLLTALLVQSVAESRLLLEYGWLLLAYLAIATRRPAASALSIDRGTLGLHPALARREARG